MYNVYVSVVYLSHFPTRKSSYNTTNIYSLLQKKLKITNKCYLHSKMTSQIVAHGRSKNFQYYAVSEV